MRVFPSRAITTVCLLLGACACSLGQTKPIAPSVRVTLQVADKGSKAWPESKEQRLKVLEEAKSVVQRRLEANGDVAEVSVTVADDDKLVIALGGVNDANQVDALIERAASRGTLEFYELKAIQSKYNPTGKWTIRQLYGNSTSYVFTGPKGEKIDSQKQPAELLSKIVRPSSNPPVITGKDIIPNAKATINQVQRPVVDIQFNARGTKVFREYTRSHVGAYLAIFFNGKLLTAPTINDAIIDGRAEITGFDSLVEARQTAESLNAGALPVAFVVIKKEVVATP